MTVKRILDRVAGERPGVRPGIMGTDAGAAVQSGETSAMGRNGGGS